MASGRDDAVDWRAIHASSWASWSSCKRTVMGSPFPVVTGRPRFFVPSLIDIVNM